MKASKPVKARTLTFWLRVAVAAAVICSFGAVGCQSTKSAGGGGSCGSGCTGH